MLGYLKSNRQLSKEDKHLSSSYRSIHNKIKEAVSFSGGTYIQYSILQELFKSSIIDIASNEVYYDTRSGQFLLYLFPLRTQIVLSSFLFLEDYKSTKELIEDVELTTSFIHPSELIEYNCKILEDTYVSPVIISLLKNVNFSSLDLYTSLKSQQLNVFFDIPLIEFSKSSIKGKLEEIFEMSTFSSIHAEEFVDIVYNNRRDSTIYTLGKSWSYKDTSIEKIVEAFQQWMNLNI